MDECIDSYGGLVWKIARKYVSRDADAHDLVQEIFMALWRSAERYDESRGSEITFIGTLASRRSIDWLRAQGRRPDLETLSPEALDMTTDSSHPSGALDGEIVMKALGTLSDEMQRLFRFHFEDGMSHREIAEETNLPLGTVKTRLRSGLLELRRLIKSLDSPQASELK